MHKKAYYIINGITYYRLLASVVLLVLIWRGELELFRWMLAISFFTDAIDGFLARKFRVATTGGARTDSMADDATVLMAIIGLVVFKWSFVQEQLLWIGILLFFFLVQTILALLKYRRFTSFHTYAAKLAAICQGTFLILAFFLKEPSLLLFYLAIVVTLIDLLEEIVLVLMLPEWEANVKGVYWVVKRRKTGAV